MKLLRSNCPETSKKCYNDTSNIIILSPSYHRIIHKAKPVFDRPSLSFHFPNGLVEKVKIDPHREGVASWEIHQELHDGPRVGNIKNMMLYFYFVADI